MVNRWSVILVIILGVITGYVVSGTSVKAQADSLPLAVGETVTLRYATDAHPSESGRWVECTVMEIRGVFVKCTPPARRHGSRAVELWRNLQAVTIIQKDR
jgi:hypothetical protein